MNVALIIEELKEKYPGKDILIQQSVGFVEIIVEIEPTKDYPDSSLALAVVGKSKPHYHKDITEIYEVLKGELTITIDGTKHMLKAGEHITINPSQIHSSEGDEVWFLTRSTPGWTPNDHMLVNK